MQFTNSTLIRKLRKKLRQIETLSRSGRDLTPEEQKKVDCKDSIREELQELLKKEEQTMATLTKEMEKSSVKEVESAENKNMKIENRQDGIQDSQDCCITDTNNGSRNVDEVQSIQLEPTISVLSEQVTRSSTTKEKNHSSKGATLTAENPIRGNTVAPTANAGERPSSSIRSMPAISSPSSSLFKDLNLKVTLLEGHHDDICAIDVYQEFIVSGGRDTSLKLWDSSSFEEEKSMGGHQGTITALSFMKDRPYTTVPSVITACYDCTLRTWNMDKGELTKSIYVYSPVICLDYSDGIAAIGTEGGKVELYNVDNGDQIFTVNAYDGAVSTIKIMSDGKIVSGSCDNDVKVFDTTKNNKTPLFSLDPDSIAINEISDTSNDNIGMHVFRNTTKINCMAVWKDLVIYGDGGYNIKILDYKKGELKKVRNNLKEFCPTEALNVRTIQGQTYLMSVGSDVDSGDSYINIRTLPNFQYLGTIRDEANNSGSITSISLHETCDKQISMVTAGDQLRVWDQVRRGKKRKGSPDASLIPCKFICNFTNPQHSEPETVSETDDDDDAELDEENSMRENNAANSSSYWWCTIL